MKPSGVFSSGDVLLSHGLSPYYHWGCSVSLPCSEWERVGPLRYLSPEVRAGLALEPHWRLCCVCSDKRRRESLGTRAIEVNRPYLKSDFKRTLNTQLSTIN